MASRHFIPRDKPRSWIVFILAAMVGIGFGLIALAGAWLKVEALYRVGYALVMSAWLVALVSWISWRNGVASGKYRDLTKRAWRDQVW
jgi:hypothetical protein